MSSEIKGYFLAFLKFIVEWVCSATGVALIKTIWEYGHHDKGGSAVFDWLETLLHNFVVDGLIVGFVIAFATQLIQTMNRLRADIKKLNQSTAIEAGSKIAEEVRTHLSSIDDKYTSISQSILNTLRASNIYIAGVRKADSEIVHLLGDCASRFEKSSDGVLILKVSSITEYSDVCSDLLNMARKSVWSMSDMGLDQTFMLYSPTPGMGEWDASGEKVRQWVTDVNNKASKLDVKRIQVVNSDRMMLVERLKAYNDAKAGGKPSNPNDVLNVVRPSLRNGTVSPVVRADALLAGWEKYIELYAKATINGWYVYNESDSHQNTERERAGCVTGEFIIIDEKYLIRYSSQTGILEILMGKVVEIFASQFENALLHQLDASRNNTAGVLSTV